MSCLFLIVRSNCVSQRALSAVSTETWDRTYGSFRTADTGSSLPELVEENGCCVLAASLSEVTYGTMGAGLLLDIDWLKWEVSVTQSRLLSILKSSCYYCLTGVR